MQIKTITSFEALSILTWHSKVLKPKLNVFNLLIYDMWSHETIVSDFVLLF